MFKQCILCGSSTGKPVLFRPRICSTTNTRATYRARRCAACKGITVYNPLRDMFYVRYPLGGPAHGSLYCSQDYYGIPKHRIDFQGSVFDV